MSELTLTLKKAIPIIAVTWILSLVTTLAVVYVVPVFLQPTWHEVATFSGTFQEFDNDGTGEFHISSNHWRLYWEVICEEPPPEDVEFRLAMWGESNFYPSTWITWLNQPDFKSGYLGETKYVTGSGVFFLLILGARLEWEIIVEAYY